MHIHCLLKFIAQSATGVKNVIVFYYICSMILFCLMHVIPAHGLCRFSSLVIDNIMKYMLKLFYLNYPHSLTSQCSIFLSKQSFS